MSKHTPGPWFVQDDHGKRWIETSGNDDTIAEIHRRRDKGSVYSCKEALANAELIAAAPDLLAALEKAREDINWMLNSESFLSGDVFAYLDSAISKARGAS